MTSWLLAGPDMGTAEGTAENEVALREQLASFRPLLALSMVLTGRDEAEILRMATTAVPSLGGCRVEGVYLDNDWQSSRKLIAR